MTRQEFLECVDTIYNLQEKDREDFNKFSDANRAKIKLVDFFNMYEGILHITKQYTASMMEDITAIKQISNDIMEDEK